MKYVFISLLFIFLSQACFAEEKLIFEPEEGAYLTFLEKTKEFNHESTEYKYTYEIIIDHSTNSCRIANIIKNSKENSSIIFHAGSILRNLEDMIILEKSPAPQDPYQEFYFIYPKLKVGFMVIGKTNDGFSSSLLPGFPAASVSAIPLRQIN
jgi:hypothetical protein